MGWASLEQRREYAEKYRPRRRIMDKLYYQKNRLVILQNQKAYAQTHREQVNLTQLHWAQKNRELSRKIKQNHYPKANARRRSLRLTNPEWTERIKQQKRDEYQKHRQSYIERAKNWMKNNPHKRYLITKKHHTKIGKPFKITASQYKFALKAWSKLIQKRDKVCQICGNVAEDSHHIFYKSLYPELSLNLNNGIALCLDCHYETHGKVI